MTGRQALEYGLRDAVTFKPIFIVNYVPVEVTGTGGGVNPRTVIGQREDGAVLLLVIDLSLIHICSCMLWIICFRICIWKRNSRKG